MVHIHVNFGIYKREGCSKKDKLQGFTYRWAKSLLPGIKSNVNAVLKLLELHILLEIVKHRGEKFADFSNKKSVNEN